MLKSLQKLVQIADKLDKAGLTKEADIVDGIFRQAAIDLVHMDNAGLFDAMKASVPGLPQVLHPKTDSPFYVIMEYLREKVKDNPQSAKKIRELGGKIKEQIRQGVEAFKQKSSKTPFKNLADTLKEIDAPTPATYKLQ